MTPPSARTRRPIAIPGAALDLALWLDEAVKQAHPDGWRGIQAREQVIKQALYDILGDVAQVARLFLVVKAQNEY